MSGRPRRPTGGAGGAGIGALRLFGIAGCDTVKRARAWLAAQGVAAPLHGFGKAGVPADELLRWIDALGWERLLNRAGSTWRRLDDARRAAVADRASAAALMRQAPSAIKRPVVQWPDGAVTVGFDAADWAARFAGPARAE
jgi:Spx/MgsR family transcriptional regulator